MTTMDILKRTKAAWPSICNATAEEKNRILSAMADSLREHVQSRVQMYKTYEPQQVQRAESAVVKTDGDCVLLIMSDAPQNAETAFKEFTK